jgi:hypothetical protein
MRKLLENSEPVVMLLMKVIKMAPYNTLVTIYTFAAWAHRHRYTGKTSLKFGTPERDTLCIEEQTKYVLFLLSPHQ